MTEERSAPWIVRKRGIKNDIRMLKGNNEVLKKLKHFMDDIEKLTSDENPAALGDHKTGRRFEECYVKRLTRSYRLVFTVRQEQREVHLLKVGDHKSVYGRD